MRENRITAIYERYATKNLSSELDIRLAFQKKQLEDYAKAHGFGNIRYFTDEGVSGTLFGADRPGLTRMIDEIERGNVAICLCRSMSRLGRGNFHVGRYMETMKANGVRLIAINDGFDSFNEEIDITLLRNALYELYLRDRGRKPQGKLPCAERSAK